MNIKFLNIKFSILLIILTSLFGCTDEETTQMSFSGFETPVITGYQARDFNSFFIYNEGIPNIRIKSIKPDQNNLIKVFPNPSIDYLWVYADNDNHSPEEIELWIVKAHYAGIDSKINEQLGGEFHSGSVPVFHKIINNNHPCIRTEGITPGYYRIYVKFNNEILWDNLAIKKDTEIWQF